ncbi:MAG: secretin N-terminal domain-containing protein, partial [Planctomycetota bacterium]
LLLSVPAIAQDAGARDEDAPVTLDLPADLELTLLAESISRELDLPILYDETLAGQRVTLRVPGEVPRSSLLGLLQSALKLKGFTLADAEQPGWKQIVQAPNLSAVARPVEDAEGAVGAVTQAFAIERGDPARIADAVRPLLTTPGGNLTAVPDTGLLIVSDYASVVRRVGEVVSQLDNPDRAGGTRLFDLQYADAPATAELLLELLGDNGASLKLSADRRTNRIIASGPAGSLTRVRTLLAELDRPTDLPTKVYRPRRLSPEAAAAALEGILGGDDGSPGAALQTSVDEATGTLTVTAPAAVQERVADLISQLDAGNDDEASPMQFYKLRNVEAEDALQTLGNLLGIATPAPRGENEDRIRNRIPTEGGYLDDTGAVETIDPDDPRTPPADLFLPPAQQAAPAIDVLGGNTEATASPGGPLIDAKLAADANTNSLIVIAPPATQRIIGELIGRLDQRRPQVQVEVTIVSLDTSDGYSFGVNFAADADVGGDGELITFGSFGVSGVDPIGPGLTPTVGAGGTVALLSPDVADVVLQALSTSSRSRLVSMPQILVNDNATGRLSSVSQEPFAVVLDGVSDVSRTSLGGLAEAGTTILVEPHISEDDYLQLDYEIELSSFTGAGTAEGLPPPSQSSTVSSAVTIPDAHTIVVGGLSSRSIVENVSGIPILRDIPLVNWVFGSRSSTTNDSTLFVFITPTILRADRFEDLKYLSDQKLNEADLPGPFPTSEPIPLQ